MKISKVKTMHENHYLILSSWNYFVAQIDRLRGRDKINFSNLFVNQ